MATEEDPPESSSGSSVISVPSVDLKVDSSSSPARVPNKSDGGQKEPEIIKGTFLQYILQCCLNKYHHRLTESINKSDYQHRGRATLVVSFLEGGGSVCHKDNNNNKDDEDK